MAEFCGLCDLLFCAGAIDGTFMRFKKKLDLCVCYRRFCICAFESLRVFEPEKFNLTVLK